MADHEFFFAIEVSGRPTSLDLVRELVSRVLAQVGCPHDKVPALVDAVQIAVTRGAAAGGSTRLLKFVVHDGRLDIAVSSGDGPPWSSSCDIA